MVSETVEVTGHDDTPIETYVARPANDARRGAVVVIHHMPGCDRATQEIVRRFAELGYDAACPNLYHREAPGADPDDAAAAARATGGVPDDRLLGDVAGAARYLRSLPTSNGRVGVIGYCSGGGAAAGGGGRGGGGAPGAGDRPGGTRPPPPPPPCARDPPPPAGSA